MADESDESDESDETRDVGADTPYPDLLQIATAENYLGDKEVVEMFLRLELDTLLGLWTEGKLKADKIQAVADYAGKVFLGEVDTYTPQRKWNEVGGIDVWLGEEFGLGGDSPADVAAHAFVMFLKEVLDLVSNLPADVLPEQWVFEGEAIIDKWVDAFTGNPSSNRLLPTVEIRPDGDDD